MQGIEIPIGAPLGQLDKDLNNAQKALKGFAVDADGNLASVGKSIATLERQLKTFKDGIKNSTDPSRILLLNNAIKSTESQLKNASNVINNIGFNKLSTGSNSAAFALTNLGRVAQDAPFGFIGIQNNLNPLLESFQRLRSENTSVAATFKALGASLIGPAGLGIALSLVTAAFTFYTQYAQKAKKETKELASATDALAASSAQEISKLTVLYDASQNLNIPLAERKKIVDELQKQFPQTFGNLSDEAILAGKAKSAYEGLTQAIIDSAVVRGGEDIIASKVKILAASLIAFQDQQRKFSEQTKGKGFLSKNNAFNVDENGDLETLSDYETRIKKEILDVRKSVQGAIGSFSAESIIGNVGGDKEPKAKKKKLTEAQKAEIEYQKRLAEIRVEAGKFNANLIIGGIERNADDEISALEKYFAGLDKVLNENDPLDKYFKKQDKANVESLLSPFKNFKLILQTQILPEIGSSFKTFFDDILMQGKFSFDSLGQAIAALGQAIKNTFLSVLANEATQGVLNLLGQKTGKNEKGATPLISGLAKLIGIGAGGAAAGVATAGSLAGVAASTGGVILGAPIAAAGTIGLGTVGAGVAAGGAVGVGTAGVAAGTVASGGLLLPILAGIAAAAGIVSLLSKKKRVPVPQASSTISTSAAGSSQDFGGGRVVFEISGTNLIGVLNRAGAKLQRFGP